MDVHCGEIKRGEIYWVDFGKRKDLNRAENAQHLLFKITLGINILQQP